MKTARITAVLLIIAICTSFCAFGAAQSNYASRVTEVNTESYITGKTTLEDGAMYLIYTVSPTQSYRKLLGNTLSGLKLTATVKNSFTYPTSVTETGDWSANLWTVEITDSENGEFKLKTPDGKYLATSTVDKNFAAILTDTFEGGFTFRITDNGRLKALESDRYLAESTSKDVWFVPGDATQTKYAVCFYRVLNWSAESEAVGYVGTVAGQKTDLAAVRFVFDCGLSDADVEKSYIVYTNFEGKAGGKDEDPEAGEIGIIASDNNGLGSFYGDVEEIDFLGTAYAFGCVKVGGQYYWSMQQSQEITQLGEGEQK